MSAVDRLTGVIQGTSDTVSQASNLVGRLAHDLGMPFAVAAASWRDQLRPASYRGVGFGVFNSRVRFGRRNAIHEYPFRDTVWVEDLGRQARKITISGFLVGDDVIAQRERLIAAAERGGDGVLVHPSLGRLTVNALDVETIEHWDKGRVYEVNFLFIEAGKRKFPEITSSTGNAVKSAAVAANSAVAGDFVSKALPALTNGAAVVAQAVQSAAAFARQGQRVINDVTNVTNMVRTLGGSFGRFFSAALSGGSILTLLAAGSASRFLVGSLGNSMVSAAGSLSGSDSTTISTFANSAQAFIGGVQTSASTPADAINGMQSMASLSMPAISSTDPIGISMSAIQGAAGDLFRQSSVIGMASSAADYVPTSANDALGMRDLVTTALGNEITIAGNQGNDATYSALKSLNAAVVQNLNEKGAALPSLVGFSSQSPSPALVLAQKIYRDSGRSLDLITNADPIHPAFMPTSFKALSS